MLAFMGRCFLVATLICKVFLKMVLSGCRDSGSVIECNASRNFASFLIICQERCCRIRLFSSVQSVNALVPGFIAEKFEKVENFRVHYISELTYE